MSEMQALLRRHASAGRVEWVGVRPERLAPMREVEHALLGAAGLEGDHARPGPRAVTLIQAEHLPVIAALSGGAEVTPELLRRNIVISGINLVALRHVTLRIGAAVVRIGKPCAPCSRMERALGPGGYNAMRGHGGWCAEVMEPGAVTVGDAVTPDHREGPSPRA
ncbi:MOSC domain-containing protein [Roseovarius sp. SCSIO 43702]|uniref:MOSC domain-containing protein n=1 Tax=Roseovarius sp. SCSIO 43702 TaxID=2823043 RepID=UPI001C729D46|nr:MOSC domain-containing protein [Roseovarius sp. SCSIO 43702]QYX58391.1 MOSC domain-containing protein [Roseovarius sp. SCSIO 43702]